MLQKPLPLQICLESFFGTKNIRFFFTPQKNFLFPPREKNLHIVDWKIETKVGIKLFRF